MERLRIIFFGSPDFSIPCLRALLEESSFDIVSVVTQPDKPVGRKNIITPPPVKVFARKMDLVCLQPRSLRFLTLSEGHIAGKDPLALDGEQATVLKALQRSDLAVVVAYGKIIPPAILHGLRFGAINVHPSALPRWRGAAPIEHTIFAGDDTTAVAIMQLTEGLDEGPILSWKEFDVRGDDTTGSLTTRLSLASGELLRGTIHTLWRGGCAPQPQAVEGTCYAEKWEADDLEIRWSEPAIVTERRIRASSPEHGARTNWQGELFKIFKARPLSASELKDDNQHLGIGAVLKSPPRTLWIQCGGGTVLEVLEAQFAGRKRLSIHDILSSRSFPAGSSFQERA